jgi:hypothetical protein
MEEIMQTYKVWDRVLIEMSDIRGENKSYFYATIRHITPKTQKIIMEKADKTRFILGCVRENENSKLFTCTKILEQTPENIEIYNRYNLVNYIRQSKFNELSTKKLFEIKNILNGD